MSNGIRTTNLERQFAIDELIGNVTEEGVEKTARIPMQSVAQQIVVSGPFTLGDGFWAATYAILVANPPADENTPGYVLDDPDPTKNGVYLPSGATWAWKRGFPDAITVLTNVGGTASAITAESKPGIDPAQVVVYILPVAYTNPGAATLSIDGGDPKPLLDPSGTALAPGAIVAGRITMVIDNGDEYRLLLPALAVAAFDHKGTYAALTTYTEGQVVTGSDGNWYQLKAASATGDDPVSGGSGNWLRILTGAAVSDNSIGRPKLTAPLASAVGKSVLEFSAVGNGSTDDTAAFNAAFTGGGLVVIPAGTYHIAGTVEVPSNTRIVGLGEVRLLGLLTAEESGWFPNVMFTNADPAGGDVNISFEGITFDFAKQPTDDYDTGADLSTNNGLYFENVRGLTFDRCRFEHYLTNLASGLTGVPRLGFGMSLFNACQQVTFRDIYLDDLREEGLQFYECQQVEIDGIYGNGAKADGSYNTSSFAAFWYCEGVTVRNGRFVHTGGSVFNCCSATVLYENIIVRRSPTRGGAGFDFGNEFADQSFDVKNITVINCDLEVTAYGITCLDVAGYESEPNVVTISGNKIAVEPHATNQALYGVLLNGVNLATIRDNEIILADSVSTAGGRCIRLSTPSGGATKNVTIANNKLRGWVGLEMSQNTAALFENIAFTKNRVSLQDIAGNSPSTIGVGMVVFMRSSGAALFEVNGLEIEGNVSEDIGGGLLAVRADVPANFSWADWRVLNNDTKGVAANMTNYCSVFGQAGERNLSWIGNKSHNGSLVVLNSVVDLEWDLNTDKWDTAYNPDRIRIYAHAGGMLRITRNRHNNYTATNYSVKEMSAGTYGAVIVTDNYGVNNVGSLTWPMDSVPANTTLPN